MAKKNGREHKASFAKDSRNGGYNIRVQGPNANRFAGREVPVTRKDGSESIETLSDLFWSGVDWDEETQQGTREPIALYHFIQKPKADDTPVDF